MNVCECDIAHRRSVAVYRVCCIRSGVSRCTLLMVLYLDCICARAGYTLCYCCTTLYLCASSLQNLAVQQDFYFPHSVLLDSGTILLTAFSMLWYWRWRVSREGPKLFYWPKLLYPYYSLLLFFTFSSFCLLVGIVGLGSSDWYGLYHSLSALQCQPVLIMIIKYICRLVPLSRGLKFIFDEESIFPT